MYELSLAVTATPSAEDEPVPCSTVESSQIGGRGADDLVDGDHAGESAAELAEPPPAEPVTAMIRGSLPGFVSMAETLSAPLSMVSVEPTT